MTTDSIPIIEWDSTSQQILLKKCKELGLATPSITRVVNSPNNSHLPANLMEDDLLLHSIVPHRKVICQCVDFVSKDGQLYFTNQRFSIPLGYSGWLEILSEDGKTMGPSKTIERIAEKAPKKFLVRSRTKAFLSNGNSGPDYDKITLVEKGTVMKIIGRLSITHGWRRQKKHILQCINSNGQTVYFDFKATGQFSPIAGPTKMFGVHSIEGIVNKFRLPLTVRIVSGQIPRVASDNDRPGVFRLLESQKDNTALFLPIRSHQKLIPVSIRTNIQLKQAVNMDDISQHQFYKALLNICTKKVEKYFQTMQVLVSAKQQSKIYSACTLPARKKSSVITDLSMGPKSMLTEEDVLFAEVDDLYAYVRRGGVPPKPRPRSWANNAEEATVLMTAEGKSSSQPMLAFANGLGNSKPRGLLATLTAGKFPSKSSTLVRQYKVSHSPTTPDQTPARTFIVETDNIPVTRRSEKIRSFIDKYQGSMESLQTEVDPYVDEWQYKNSTESIDIARRSPSHNHQHSYIPNERRIVRPRPFSTPLEIIQTPVNHSPSPTEFKAHNFYKYRHSEGQSLAVTFLKNNTKFQQTVQAT